jgi:predicted kinase
MTLYLPVGPPGCGKSTLADALVADQLLQRDAVVCPDRYREVLTGSRASQKQNERVFSICNTIAVGRMTSGLDVWFDATNLPYNPQLAAIAANLHQPVVHVLFDHLTVSCLVERNATRQHPVPDDVLTRYIGYWADVKPNNLSGYIINANELRPTLKASKSQ